MKYYVNGETQETTINELTEDEILAKAKFIPTARFKLFDQDEGELIKVKEDNINIKITEGKRFLALGAGPVTVS